MNGSFRVRDGSWYGFDSGGFQRQIHEKEKRQHQERSTTTVINIYIQAAGLRLGLLTAVLSDIVHSVMVTVEESVT